MSTTTPTAEESIEPRTRRAVTGNMVVVPYGGGTGMFDVYSAKDGENNTYAVDLREERCLCPDHQHRKPENGCKHIRRVKLALGIMDVPEALRDEIDGVLAHSREKYGADVDPNTLIDNSGGQEVVADGGRDACENGQVGCGGPDGDKLPCFDCYREKPARSEPADFGGGESTGVQEL